jgi:hypothetical protein
MPGQMTYTTYYSHSCPAYPNHPGEFLETHVVGLECPYCGYIAGEKDSLKMSEAWYIMHGFAIPFYYQTKFMGL